MPDTTQPSPSSQPASTKKSSQPTKLVDMGAAAAFASQAAAESQRKETANSTIDTVFGDFSSQTAPQPPPPTAASGVWVLSGVVVKLCGSLPPGSGNSGGFADFEGAFGGGRSSEPAKMGGGGEPVLFLSVIIRDFLPFVQILVTSLDSRTPHSLRLLLLLQHSLWWPTLATSRAWSLLNHRYTHTHTHTHTHTLTHTHTHSLTHTHTQTHNTHTHTHTYTHSLTQTTQWLCFSASDGRRWWHTPANVIVIGACPSYEPTINR